ncbi:MAG: YebC/PmpR family DNA-binding transcriptional regulator [Planctomycetaceae bacterium]|nr:YebC/PmpR family DNA-binding transcriptional regulator [Planctomycetaceae bacterium]
MGRDYENRKHAIAKTAAHKSKLYTKYARQLYVVAKSGVPDPESNPALRNMIERAKREQVPAHVIEKAIDKAKGAGGEAYSPARYEGYGPGGCCVIVECLTDNPTRTITDVRICFTKTNSKLGATGSVAHFFDHFAVLACAGDNEDEVLEALLNADVDVTETECENGRITIFAPASEFSNAIQAFQDAFPETELTTQEIAFVPQSTVAISEEDVPMFEKFLDMLNDCDDVQEVYHNAELPETSED